MILVQNLLQQLSGSKKIFFLVIICSLIATSCVTTKAGKSGGSPWGNKGEVGILKSSDKKDGNSQTTANTDDTGTDSANPETNGNSTSDNNITDNIDSTNNDNLVEKPDTIIEIIDNTYTKGILHTYNVLVLLPFNVHKNSLDYEKEKIDPKSKVSLEFYQGMLQSLRELQAEGMNFTLRVYDTRIDQYRTKSLLKSLEYESIDLIIGPVYNKCLQEAAEWARVHKTYLVSPIASNANFITENPYFIAVNPTINAHISKLAQYITGEKNVNKITIITNGNSNKDTKLAQDIERQLSSLVGGIGDFYNNTSVNVIYESEETDNEWKDYLIENIDNHVIVASMDEVFSSDIVRRLQLLSRRYPIILYGMPNWRRFNNMNIDYLESLNFHITAVNNNDKNDMNQQLMKDTYKANVGIMPSDFSKRGYDVSNYLFTTMNRYGADLATSLPRAGRQSGCFMDFYVSPSRSYQGATRLYENTAVKMLEFNDYEFKQVR